MIPFVDATARFLFVAPDAATRRLMLATIALAALGLIGWVAAALLDSALLGFVFADLVVLVGVALRGALTPQRSRAGCPGSRRRRRNDRSGSNRRRAKGPWWIGIRQPG